MKNIYLAEGRPVFVCFSMAVAVGLIGLASGLGSRAEAQSRPPISSGASGGANPGNTGSGSYNPGSNSGSGYNPGNTGGGGFNPGSNSGSGYNPGNTGGSGYNPGSNSGGGYNPGNNNGSGYNPGNYNGNFVIAYRDSGFRGASVRFDGEIANLHHTGLNDEISSMRFRGTWLACADADFRGRCRTFRNSVRDLRDSGMNDQISSLRPVR
jgi:hypothetical protein